MIGFEADDHNSALKDQHAVYYVKSSCVDHCLQIMNDVVFGPLWFGLCVSTRRRQMTLAWLVTQYLARTALRNSDLEQDAGWPPCFASGYRHSFSA